MTDQRTTADADLATARRLLSEGGDDATDAAAEHADRAVQTYLELGDVPAAADALWFLGRLDDSRGRTDDAARHLREAVEGFVVTHDDRADEVADELFALLRRTGQTDRVEEFLTWRLWLVGTMSGEQERTTAAGRRRAL